MRSVNAKSVDLLRYRASDAEMQRTSDVLRLVPGGCSTALDVGAREGHFSTLLAQRIARVTALDLEVPVIDDPQVQCVQGDLTRLQFAADAFDLVVCTEVLEHIDPPQLPQACAELTRVCAKYLLVGVPFRQDIRVGRTTCSQCRTHNPPWGHVNRFDIDGLLAMFPALHQVEVSYVGRNRANTNALSAVLLDLAGNPYGTYGQDEGCVECGARLQVPPPRNLGRKLLTKAGHFVRQLTQPFQAERANWVHVLFVKPH